MGGVFGVVSREDCVLDLFYGTDFHSHLGTRRGGLAVRNSKDFTRFIHNIENAQFRSKFDDDIAEMQGHVGIGCISDTEDQPLIHGCRFLNFSRSKSELDLAGHRSISELVGHQEDVPLDEFADHRSDGYCAMVERIRHRLDLTSLQYQTLPDMVDALDTPKERVCTYCWDGRG